MAAQYPTAVKSFTAINDGDTISDEMFEEAHDEVNAIESGLLNGLEHPLRLAAATELTIAAGVITVSKGYVKIDTEADAAADDLATITPGTNVGEGSILVCRAENVARVVTLKDGTGNLLLNGDYALSATDRTITLLYDGSNWREIARSVNSAGSTLVNGAITGVSVDSTGFVDSATQPRCVAYHNTTQSISHSTNTAVLFNAEVTDVGGMHDTASNTSRFTVPAGGDGFYLLTGYINYTAAASGVRSLWWDKNGAAVAGLSGQASVAGTTAAAGALTITALVTLAAGDYVELFTVQNSGGSVNIGHASDANVQSMAQVVKLW